MATVSPAPAALPEWPPATSGHGTSVVGQPLRPPAAGWAGDPSRPRDRLPKGLPAGTARAAADLLPLRLPEKPSVALSSLARRLPSPGVPVLAVFPPAPGRRPVELPQASRAAADASALPARLAPVGPARAPVGQSVQRVSITATAKRMPSPEPFARFVSGPSQLGLNADARRPAGEAVRAAQP